MRRLLFNVQGMFNYAMHAIIQRIIIVGIDNDKLRRALGDYRENIEVLDYNQDGLRYYTVVRKLLELHPVR